uniref:Uncharacterized protein n=1 Tax=Setaria digitata TaxID=48799 RepID=A0A915Q3S0_9BILA
MNGSPCIAHADPQSCSDFMTASSDDHISGGVQTDNNSGLGTRVEEKTIRFEDEKNPEERVRRQINYPSVGALPKEWLDPDQKNFHTKGITDRNSDIGRRRTSKLNFHQQKPALYFRSGYEK